MNKGIRLNKYISDSGICSRREADKYIENGVVFVNGKRAEIGDAVTKRDRVLLNGLLIESKKDDDYVVIALNKPRGIISTTDRTEPDNIVSFVGYHERIFPIGRLDKDSQGLIFLTNNGDIVNKILRAGNAHEKEYIVTVNRPITDEFVEKMSSGIPILGRVTKKCKVEKISEFVFSIILVQGLNRQIRRMCEYLGYNVTKLERIRIMNISLKGIPLGDWRYLTPKEMDVLNRATSHSTNDNFYVERKSGSSKTQVKSSTKDLRTSFSDLTTKDGTKSKSTKDSSKTPAFNPKAKELRKKNNKKPKFSERTFQKPTNSRSKKR